MEKSILEIFTLITGLIYIILEIRQKNFMWVLGIMTSLASMLVFFRQGLYASFGLNTYYLVTAFIGLWQWGKDKDRLPEESSGSIHLNRLTWPVVAVSGIMAIAGILALTWGMSILSEAGFKENPMPLLDASVAVLSAIATWWLVRSYLEQWWLWIAANTLSVILCITQEMWWMTGLYAAYTLAAFIGYRHWKKSGVII